MGQHDVGTRRQQGLAPLAELADAIHPDRLGTIFSGSAVVDESNTAGFESGAEQPIVCIFTSAGQPFAQSLAYSTDRGRSFTKYPKNPVLPHVIGGNRDPKVSGTSRASAGSWRCSSTVPVTPCSPRPT